MTSSMASKDFGLTRLSFDLAGTIVTVELCLATGQQQVGWVVS